MAEAPVEGLHACRTGQRAYAWVLAGRRRGRFGAFVCRGCGARTCGTCAEEDGHRRRVPPAHVPLLCRRHGGLRQLGLPPVIGAIAVGMVAIVERRGGQPEQRALLAE
jgi:hypothetical protein